MKTIVITGSNGFIGRFLTEKLCQKYNIISLEKKNGYEMKNSIKIDFKNKIHYFIHSAFQIDSKNLTKKKYFELNYLGVQNSLEFCKKYSIKFIFLSSYVYGVPQNLPIDTNHPINPHNQYAYIKYKCENLCYEFSKKFNLNYIILRLFNIYGKGQKEGNLFADILKQINNKKVFLQHINSKRDFLHINDFASLMEKIIEKNVKKNMVLNVGSGKSTSLKDIVNYFTKKNKHIKFYELNSKYKDLIYDCYADISLIQHLFDWRPKISIERGINQLLKND